MKVDQLDQTLAEVEGEALVNTLAFSHGTVEVNTLGETLREVK